MNVNDDFLLSIMMNQSFITTIIRVFSVYMGLQGYRPITGSIINNITCIVNVYYIGSICGKY